MDTEEIKPEVDKESDFVKTGEVFIDDDGLEYDVNLLKVDVKFGKYGINNFYKMQVSSELLPI